MESATSRCFQAKLKDERHASSVVVVVHYISGTTSVIARIPQEFCVILCNAALMAVCGMETSSTRCLTGVTPSSNTSVMRTLLLQVLVLNLKSRSQTTAKQRQPAKMLWVRLERLEYQCIGSTKLMGQYLVQQHRHAHTTTIMHKANVWRCQLSIQQRA